MKLPDKAQLKDQLKRWRWRLQSGVVSSSQLHPELESTLHQLEAASHEDGLRDSANRDHLLLSEFDDACYRALTALDNDNSATALEQLLAALQALEGIERRQRAVDLLATVRTLRREQPVDQWTTVRHLPAIRAIDSWLERAQARIDARQFRQAEALCRFARRTLERWQQEPKLAEAIFQLRSKVLGQAVRETLDELRAAGFHGLSEQLLGEALIEADARRQPTPVERQRRRQVAEQIGRTETEITEIHQRLAQWQQRRNHG